MWNPSLTPIHKSLSNLYTDPRSAERLADQAGLPVNQINLTGASLDFWYDILSAALLHERLETLMAIILSENPQDEKLRQVWSLYDPSQTATYNIPALSTSRRIFSAPSRFRAPEIKLADQSIALQEKVGSFFERLSAAYADQHGQSLSKLTAPLAIVLRWFLLYIVPFIFGVKAESLIQDIPLDRSIISLSLWVRLFREYWILLLLLALFILGLVWRNHIEYTRTSLNRIRDALAWMYEDLKEEIPNHKQADIRITIWVPVKRNQKPESYRMKQLINYLPDLGKPTQDNITYFRVNKPAGRIFRFSKCAQDDSGNEVVVAIGIVGLCALSYLLYKKAQAFREKIPASIQDKPEFVDYMITNWNFTRPQAELLTSNRRAYLCIPVINRQEISLYGIIYLDARDPEALSSDIGTKIIDSYLSRVARAFVAPAEQEAG